MAALNRFAQVAYDAALDAVALADAAAQQLATKRPSSVRIAALGKVYENYVHCVVRKNSGIRDFSQLAGRTVAVGQPGSGTSLITPRLIEAAGLKSSPTSDPGARTREKPSPS